MHEDSAHVPDRRSGLRLAVERLIAAGALILMTASFFLGFAIILGLGYEYVVGQAVAFCR